MAKCSNCGKWGLFLRLVDGLCADCIEAKRKHDEELRLAEERKRQEEQKKQEQEEWLRVYNLPSSRLDRITQKRLDWPVMLNGIPKVYHYAFPVKNVDRDNLYAAAKDNNFHADLQKADDNEIQVIRGDLYLGRLASAPNILLDWLDHGYPVICQFTVLRKGEEHLGISLYRDDESRLSHHQSSVAKLTAYTTDDRQCNIGCLEQGQKLFVETDDNGKMYVRDINYHDIGRLPAKYQRMYDDGTLKGMFFDHSEQAENANGSINDVPFVRFYFE